MKNLLGKARRKSPSIGRAASLAKQADAARDLRDWPTAATAYAASLGLDPDRADLWVQLGHARKESGDLDGAHAAYLESVSRVPDLADTHLQIGHVRKLQGALDDAGAAYLRAAELDPSLKYPIDELRRLSIRGIAIDQTRLAAVMAAASFPARPGLTLRSPAASSQQGDLRQLAEALEAAVGSDDHLRLAAGIRMGLAAAEAARALTAGTSGDPPAHLVFDVSDLIGYFEKARLPTGIQRVQIEVITALLNEPDGRYGVSVCSFSKARDQWAELPIVLFAEIAALSRLSGDIQDPAWLDALENVQTALDLSGAFAFEHGAYLINLGTSWWLQNYFLHVRQAKEQYGIHYIPFVHDMIPIMTPEHCTRPLTQDFISWALGVFSHADYFFTNSDASKRDLVKVALTLGYDLLDENIHVVRLDADFAKPESTPLASTLGRYGLTEGKYVLFVSTIESRKNHLSAFKAWLTLLERHPAKDVPTLVCVGNRGWLNDQVFAKLEGSAALRARVHMVSKVSDADLANLYRGCSFTIYPSSYEGWGLPVTESLSYGKAALISDASSLPEAGGRFADYFAIGDQDGFVTGIERLSFDGEYRKGREALIKSEYRPRTWSALGLEIGAQIRTWSSQTEEPVFQAARPDLGRYYWIHRVEDTAIHPGMIAAEIFRTSQGWWQPDDWGCWTKPTGGNLTLNLDRAEGPLRLYLGLLGLGSKDLDVLISLGGATIKTDRLARSETKWLALPIGPDHYASGTVNIGVWGSESEDFAVTTNGIDSRVVSVGVIGFMICREDDYASRVAFTEALTFNDLAALSASRPSINATYR